jgi:hypothetical protein
MATAIAHPAKSSWPAPVLPGLRYDHYFFTSVALLMLVTVFVGFGPTYYWAGVLRAPLPSFIIHLHAAAFICWILLLITQASLVTSGRIDIHRRLGIAGFLLACAMLILGILAATDSLVREAGPVGRDAKFFYIIPLSNILVFAVLTFFAFRTRFNPAAHKRLILIATMGLLVAAIARWPFATVHKRPAIASLFSYIFLVLMVAYDLWSTRKVHPATLWAGTFLVSVEQVSPLIGRTVAWHSFATWVQTVAR